MPASAGVTGLRRLAAVGIGCVLALSAARVAMGADTAAPSSDLPPIVIGVSNVQTGPSSDLGHELVGGSKAYFDLINSGGGIHGRKISILLKDDKYEPDPAVKNTNELIEHAKVFFLFDYIGTPTLTRTLPLLAHKMKEDRARPRIELESRLSAYANRQVLDESLLALRRGEG